MRSTPRATRIDLSVERGGKDLVRVADNGTGMAPDDLVLAFQPHATSKLAEADDLYRIRTLGFRGEALAAIAEVAKVRCQTRQAGAGEGSELSIEGGVRPGQDVRLPGRHGDRSPQPVLQHSRAPDVPQVGHDRGGHVVRDVFADRARASRRSTSRIARGARSSMTCRRCREPRADRDLLRPRAGRVAALGRGPAGRDASLGLRRPPVAEPVDREGAVPLPRRAVTSATARSATR